MSLTFVKNLSMFIVFKRIQGKVKNNSEKRKNRPTHSFFPLPRGVFRTQWNIYDGAFLRKKLTAKNR